MELPNLVGKIFIGFTGSLSIRLSTKNIMGQKSNPISLRLLKTNRSFDSCWSSHYFYTDLLSRTLSLDHYFSNILNQVEYPVGRIFIQSGVKISHCTFFYPRKKGFLRFSLPQTPSRKGVINRVSMPFLEKTGEFVSRNQQKNLYTFFSQVDKLKHYNHEKKIGVYHFSYCYNSFLFKYCSETDSEKKKNLVGFLFQKKKTLKKNNQRKNLHLETLYKFGLISPSVVEQKIENNTGSLSIIQRCEWFLCNQFQINTVVNPIKMDTVFFSATFLADDIVYCLHQKMKLRFLYNQIKKLAERESKVKGIRISCSGRMGGRSKKAQRAQTESMKFGQTGLQVFSAKVDYAERTAYTPFGLIGVKVWICFQ